MRAADQEPAVIGQLLAGIVLGPRRLRQPLAEAQTRGFLQPFSSQAAMSDARSETRRLNAPDGHRMENDSRAGQTRAAHGGHYFSRGLI